MKRLNWWIIVVILILLNCQKEKSLPTAYEDIFGDKEGVIADTILVQESGTEKFFSRLINTYSSPYLLLGSYDHYHSAIYIKFDDFPDSVHFHSASLFLDKSPIDSALGTPQSQFTVHLYFSEYDWDSQADPEQYLEQLPFMNQPFHKAIITSDTTNEIKIELDTLVISQWADTTSGVPNYGFWIDSPDAEFITSFYSIENLDLTITPQIRLIYSSIDSIGTKRDTSTVYAKKDAFLIVNDVASLNLSDNFFYIGKGLAFRSFLKYNLSSFDSTVHLNRALLKIVINNSYSIRNDDNTTDGRIFRVDGASWLKNEVNENPATGVYSGTLTDSILTFEVTPTVQSWIDRRYENYGFLIRSINEEQTLSRAAFYSSKSSSDLQPRLYLYYTLPPKQEF